MFAYLDAMRDSDDEFAWRDHVKGDYMPLIPKPIPHEAEERKRRGVTPGQNRTARRMSGLPPLQATTALFEEIGTAKAQAETEVQQPVHTPTEHECVTSTDIQRILFAEATSAQIVEEFLQIFHRTATLPSIGHKELHVAEMTKRDAAVDSFTRLCQELREHGHAWAFILNIGSHLPVELREPFRWHMEVCQVRIDTDAWVKSRNRLVPYPSPPRAPKRRRALRHRRVLTADATDG